MMCVKHLNRCLKQLLPPSQPPLVSAVRHNPFPLKFKHFLENRPGTQCTMLPNGLTIATQERPTPHACFGIFLDAGSRYEDQADNGISNFYQHVVFKSTRCRTRDMLHSELINLGAKFRCFTSRELVAYYVHCLREDVPRAFNILCDCVFNHSYAQEEIEYQKKVVYSEMMERDKNTFQTLYDYLHSAAYCGTPLARTVIGPSANLYNFNGTTITRYLAKCYDPQRAAVVAVGGVGKRQIVDLTTEHLCHLKPITCREKDFYRYTASDLRYRDDSKPKAHVIVAVEGPSFCNEDMVVMDVARHMIGGWDNSQPHGRGLAPNVARVMSEYQLCDAYKSFSIKYKDCGLWGIHFLGPTVELDELCLLIQEEWMKMCLAAPDGEVERAKRQLKTELLSKTESLRGDCHDLARWMLYYGFRPNLAERLEVIDAITPADVQEVCTKYLYNRDPVVVAMGPTEGLMDYTRIQSWMYWLRY